MGVKVKAQGIEKIHLNVYTDNYRLNVEGRYVRFKTYGKSNARTKKQRQIDVSYFLGTRLQQI